jgi:uncharacterized protein with HEPN domain
MEVEAHYRTMKKLISMLKRMKRFIPKNDLKNHRDFLSFSIHFTTRNLDERKWGLSLQRVSKNVFRKFNWRDITLNRNIPTEFIDAHPDMPWDRNALARRIAAETREKTREENNRARYKVTFEELMAMDDDFEDVQGFDRWIDTWSEYCTSPELDIERVIANPSRHWDWAGISSNPVITMDIVKSHPELPWSWDDMSCNPSLTMEFVETHPMLPWDWKCIMNNDFIPDYEKELNEIKRRRYSIIYNRFSSRVAMGFGM